MVNGFKAGFGHLHNYRIRVIWFGECRSVVRSNGRISHMRHIHWYSRFVCNQLENRINVPFSLGAVVCAFGAMLAYWIYRCGQFQLHIKFTKRPSNRSPCDDIRLITRTHTHTDTQQSHGRSSSQCLTTTLLPRYLSSNFNHWNCFWWFPKGKISTSFKLSRSQVTPTLI